MVHSARNAARSAGAGRALAPTITYRDAPAMVDWLVEAFGFEKRSIVKRETGEIARAELAFGDSIIIVVPAQDAAFERLLVHPDQIGGVETQSCHLMVPASDAHRAKASAMGAEVIAGPGGKNGHERTYASRDPEGHVWMFGTYCAGEHRDLYAPGGRWRGRGHKFRLRTLLLALAPLALVALIV